MRVENQSAFSIKLQRMLGTAKHTFKTPGASQAEPFDSCRIHFGRGGRCDSPKQRGAENNFRESAKTDPRWPHLQPTTAGDHKSSQLTTDLAETLHGTSSTHADRKLIRLPPAQKKASQVLNGRNMSNFKPNWVRPRIT